MQEGLQPEKRATSPPTEAQRGQAAHLSLLQRRLHAARQPENPHQTRSPRGNVTGDESASQASEQYGDGG